MRASFPPRRSTRQLSAAHLAVPVERELAAAAPCANFGDNGGVLSARSEEPAMASWPEVTPRSAHVLVVDDEPAVRESLRSSLSFEGYQVGTAENGLEALTMLESAVPDLVVLDVLMPRMDGLTACRRIRSRGLLVPVLLLTARDTVGDRVTGLDAGADDYLVKPFELDELLARVRALVRRGSLTAAAEPDPDGQALSFADLRMNQVTREVSRAGHALELTRTEYALLALFLSHPGQVLTREQILSAVWGIDFEPSSNSLDVYVMYLRRKTEIGGCERLIHTVRGVGYVLRTA
jgi:two-component system response regulator MprA